MTPPRIMTAKSYWLPFLLSLLLFGIPHCRCQVTTSAVSMTTAASGGPTSSVSGSVITVTTGPTLTTIPPTPVPATNSPAQTSKQAFEPTASVSPTGPGLPTSSSDAVPMSSASLAPSPAPGCGRGLDPIYSSLCDRRAVWGIVLESLGALGFALSVGLLLGLLLWSLWRCLCCCRCCCCRCCRRNAQRGCSGVRCGGAGGGVAALLLFLLGTAGLFGLIFAFVVELTPRTCPARLFLFGVLSALCFAALLARALALLGFAAARGWGEAVVVLVLTAVQVIIAVEWLLMVLVRDRQPCLYSQEEFVMLLIYVLCLLAAALLASVRLAWRTRRSYGYSYRHTASWSRAGRTQALLLLFTVLLAAGVWVAWIALLTRGNPEMGRRPAWDEPVLSVALAATGWLLLLGHGVSQLAFLCGGERRDKSGPLDFTSWTSPSPGMGSLPSPKGGRDNSTFENDTDDRRGRKPEPVLRSPYESGFSMTEIDPDRDYSIPRPQTTNINEPYDEYYGPRLA